MNHTHTIFVLSRLRIGKTEHSALENYTKGLHRGFKDFGLNVRLLNLTAIDRCEAVQGRLLRKFIRGLARVEPVALFISFFYSLTLAVRYWPQRDSVILFVNNAARIDIPFLKVFQIMGYHITFWITDYYPERKTFIDSIVSKYATNVIAINGFIAQQMPDNMPCDIFYGGSTRPAPTHLNKPSPDQPLHLIYAGKLNALNAIDKILEISAQSPTRVQLALFGDGPMAELAEQYAEKYPNITMYGLVPLAQVLEAMNTAHAVLSLRRVDDGHYKGFFPSKLIEQLTSPAQMIISDMGNITDMLKPCAILVPKITTNQILRAISDATRLTLDQEILNLEHRQALLTNTFDWKRLSTIVIEGGSRL